MAFVSHVGVDIAARERVRCGGRTQQCALAGSTQPWACTAVAGGSSANGASKRVTRSKTGSSDGATRSKRGSSVAVSAAAAVAAAPSGVSGGAERSVAVALRVPTKSKSRRRSSIVSDVLTASTRKTVTRRASERVDDTVRSRRSAPSVLKREKAEGSLRPSPVASSPDGDLDRKSTDRRRSGGGASGGHLRRNSSVGPAATAMRQYLAGISQDDLLERAQEIALANQVRALVDLQKVRSDAARKLGRPVPLNEWAEMVGMTAQDLTLAMQLGTRAKNQLVTSNMGLVHNVAGKYAGKVETLTFQDLVQEGAMGLMRAAEKFDAKKGWRFSTYATWWIRASMMRCMDHQERSIRVPGPVLDQFRLVKKTFTVMSLRKGREPTNEELAKELKLSTDKLRFILQSGVRKPSSVDQNVARSGSNDDAHKTLLDILRSDENVEENIVGEMLKGDLDRVLRRYLNPQERGVVRLRFGLEDGHTRTLEEVGKALKLSRERIRQVVFTAMRKLRDPRVQAALQDYL
ncbi:RNA polymerase sigma factor SigA [Porphyridium purpureum]|uniref:RNA polymerase sigma factor SigA n=1 Tax=Porphyridium purpureum TaxID=35688 RepID=A0A5J4Z7E3_PORPP|nr:RNA polymerase sigma factor SigA [Porphyridium purpureum]|eukprot:POR8117..scf295_1